MKNFSRFIMETRGVPFTRRGEEIELDGVPLSAPARDALFAEFDSWEEPLESRLAAKRYAVETGGTTWNGWPLSTDRASQATVGNAHQLAKNGHWTDGSVWKFADGVPRGLTAAQVVEMALVVAEHVQACFEVEAQKLAAHENGEDVDIDAGWPA